MCILLTLSTMKSIESAMSSSTSAVVKLFIIIFFKTKAGITQKLLKKKKNNKCKRFTAAKDNGMNFVEHEHGDYHSFCYALIHAFGCTQIYASTKFNMPLGALRALIPNKLGLL